MIQHMMPLTASRVVVENAPDRLVIREDRWGGRTVADLGEYTAEKHALGELFAAAPDMHKALETIRAQVDVFCDACDQPDPDSVEESCEVCPLLAIDSTAYAALAKAEGK